MRFNKNPLIQCWSWANSWFNVAMSVENDNALCDCYAVVWLKAKHRRSQCATRHILAGDVNKLIPQVNALIAPCFSGNKATPLVVQPVVEVVEQSPKPNPERDPHLSKQPENDSDEVEAGICRPDAGGQSSAVEVPPDAFPIEGHGNTCSDEAPAEAVYESCGIEGTGSVDTFSFDDLTKMLETEASVPGPEEEQEEKDELESPHPINALPEALQQYLSPHSRTLPLDYRAPQQDQQSGFYTCPAYTKPGFGAASSNVSAAEQATGPRADVVQSESANYVPDWGADDEISVLTEPTMPTNLSSLTGDRLSVCTEERLARLEAQIQRLSQLQQGNVTLHAANVTIITAAPGAHQNQIT